MAKSAAAKKADARRKLIRERTIKNLTGDTELARAYRSRSNERIFQELGIRIPDRVPRLKEARNRGTAAETVRTYVRSRPTVREQPVVERFIERAAREERAPKVKREKKPKSISGEEIDPKLEQWSKTSIAGRKDLWRRWSNNKKQEMPKEIRRLAFKINREAGLTDQTAAYGFAVIYYAFVRGEPIELWKKRLVPDRDFDGEVYLNVSGFNA
jgi:hypothetical protein